MGGALLSTFKYEIFPKIGLLHFLSFYAFQEMWICYLTFMPTGSGWNRKKSAAATVQNYTVPSKSNEGQNLWNSICLYWFCIYYYDVIIKPKAIIMRLCLLFLFQLNTLYSLESRNDQGKIIDILMESKGYQKLNLHLGAKILLLKVRW